MVLLLVAGIIIGLIFGAALGVGIGVALMVESREDLADPYEVNWDPAR